MGASLSSSFSFGKAKEEAPSPAEQNNNTSTAAPAPAATATATPGRKKKKSASVRIKQEITRRSRRVTKSDPSKVVFPVPPKAKTPAKKKYPLTPKSRKNAEKKSKPILRRKSPRAVKHKTNNLPTETVEGVLKYTPNAVYQEGEAIFAWDRGVLYEAKVVQCGDDSGSTQYHVHYLGYKKTQDKWIPITKMMKVEPVSRKMFRELRGKLPEKVDELMEHNGQINS